jgi:hypothetical protein
MAPPRFQYTLRDLFLATTLIAFGVGGWMIVLRDMTLLGVFVVLPICGGLMGAGILAPFHEKMQGAYLGFFGGMLYVLLVLFKW